MKKITQTELLRMANDAKQTAQRFNQYGFWRMARDNQKHSYLLNKLANKVNKK